MSRLCRLKAYKGIGEDGKWAYEEIIKLRQQRNELLAAAKIILSDAPLDNGVMALAAAVRNAKDNPMINALEKDLDAATDEATRGEI